MLIRLDLLEYKLTFNEIQEIAYLDKIFIKTTTRSFLFFFFLNDNSIRNNFRNLNDLKTC